MLNSTEITFLENETWSNSLKIDNESQIVLFLKSPFFPLLKNKQKKKPNRCEVMNRNLS